MTQFIKKIRFYAAILFSRDTPLLVKILLAAGLLYLVHPFDFITDTIPLLGLLDDVTVGSILIVVALRLVPGHVVEKVRRKIYKQES